MIAKIKAAVKSNHKKFGVQVIDTLTVKLLGSGENNTNYLVQLNGGKYTFRVAKKEKSIANLEREFSTIKTLPAGFGPTPIFLDKTRKHINTHYAVYTYIEGKHIRKWSKKHLKLHAEKLAHLHSHKAKSWGKLHEKKKRAFSAYSYLLDEISGFQKPNPEIFDDPTIKVLNRKVKEYVRNNDHLFKALKEFPFVHKDTCITNTLFTKEGIRYIDWEWSGYFDGAVDLAFLFDEEYAYSPWGIKLNGDRLRFYLNSYNKIAKDKTLEKRIKVWNVILKYSELLYFTWVSENYAKSKCDLPEKVYTKSRDEGLKSLKKFFQI